MYYQIKKQYIKMLNNLSSILDKAVTFSEEKKIEPEVLLNSRLAPDQFNLIKQIQVACDGAKLGMARLIGQENNAPKCEDNEKTVSEIKERIKLTVDYLETLKEEDFKNLDDRKIVYSFMKDKYVTPEESLIEFSLPNFYFHVTTAYAILRHNGLNIGKMDYIGSVPFKDI
jgi:hypothetical protein